MLWFWMRSPGSVQVRGAAPCVASNPCTSSVGLLLTRPFSRNTRSSQLRVSHVPSDSTRHDWCCHSVWFSEREKPTALPTAGVRTVVSQHLPHHCNKHLAALLCPAPSCICLLQSIFSACCILCWKLWPSFSSSQLARLSAPFKKETT